MCQGFKVEGLILISSAYFCLTITDWLVGAWLFGQGLAKKKKQQQLDGLCVASQILSEDLGPK